MASTPGRSWPRERADWATRCSRRRPPRPCASATARRLVTDGPFAETKEQLGGYYLVEAQGPRRGERDGRAKIPGAAYGIDRGAADHGLRRDADARTRRRVDGRSDRARCSARSAGASSRRSSASSATSSSPRRRCRRRSRPRSSAGRATACPRTRGAWITTTAARTRRSTACAAQRALARRQARGAAERDGAAATRARREDARRDVRRRRSAAPDLHLLPPGARARGAGRADAAHARRPHDRGDRARVPRPRADDGAAAGAREAQDPRRRHPVRACRRADELPERLERGAGGRST